MPNHPHIEVPKLRLQDLHRYIPDSERSEIPSTPKSLPNEIDDGSYQSARYAEYQLRLIAAYCRALKDGLELYLPLPAADAFHSSYAHIRLLSGSNQAGKTLAAMAEFARIIRGRDPYMKRSTHDLMTLSVGKDQDHIGQVMWRKLWFPGAFEIVPDEIDGFWRAVRPDPNDPKHVDPIDLARKDLWQPAPPLLAPGEIAKLSYEKKSEGIPSQVELSNGTVAIFCTSKGSPRQGIQCDLVHFDEEIENKSWLPEMMARLVRRHGIFMWSFTPQASTPQAFELHRRAEFGESDVAEYKLLIDDNPYYPDASKEALYNDLMALGEEELSVRWYGNYAIAGRSVYPTYDIDLHGTAKFTIPNDWMRVAAFDPGARVQAAILGAVPPDLSALHVYAEVVVKNKDAYAFAKEFNRAAGGNRFEAYIIDKKGAQPRALGRSNSTADHYTTEFKRAGVIPSRLSGVGFVYGNSDVDSRELSVKRLLSEGKLKLHRGATTLLDKQIKARYYDLRNPTRRETRTEHDLCDCLEYLVAFFDDSGLYHKMPKPNVDRMTRYDRVVNKRIEQERRGGRRITGFASA